MLTVEWTDTTRRTVTSRNCYANAPKIWAKPELLQCHICSAYKNQFILFRRNSTGANRIAKNFVKMDQQVGPLFWKQAFHSYQA
jgi:hypothetical protein